MATSVFDYQDYKVYIDQRLNEGEQAKRGARSRLARTLGCQPGYVSRVLSGDAHFSLEQADLANQFLGHTDDESAFLILLVEWARAGSQRLRTHFQRQIEHHRSHYLNLKNRLQIQNRLSEHDQAVYFSHWHFAAVHAFLSVPELQSKEVIASRLNLPVKRVAQVIDYLLNIGLIRQDGGRYLAGVRRLHLGNDSPLIAKHHINWRLQAIRSLERDEGEDLHYSSVASLSEKDVLAIKSQLVKAIESVKSAVRDSRDETVACFSLDFFKL